MATYAERRAAGEFEAEAARREELRLAALALLEPLAAPEPRQHVPLGSDVELAEYIDAVDEGEPGGGGGWPTRALIVAYETPKAESGFAHVNAASSGESAGVAPFGTRFYDNADGSWVEWYVALGVGIYSLALKSYLYDGSGIVEFSIDGTPIDEAPYGASGASVDTYSGASNSFSAQQIVADDLTIPASGLFTLRATVNGKNASSTGFVTNVCYVSLAMVAQIA